jgi:ADP-heptose:LPS heptosyltransferase
MNLPDAILNLIAQPLKIRRTHRPAVAPVKPRILIIRRNRMGDMIYTLPLLHALRRHFPHAHLAVACDPAGAQIAQACRSVNEVIVLDSGWNAPLALLKNAGRMQNYDWVIAAKGGFDRRLAVLARLTNAALRIGFERQVKRPSEFYTDPVALPLEPQDEHQIDTLLRLLRPLGLIKPTSFTIDLSLTVPADAREFAATVLDSIPAAPGRLVLINLSSTVPLKFREEDFIALASRILGATEFVIAFVAAPTDQQSAHEIAECMGSKRVIAVDTPGPLDLAALLETCAFLFTPEGGAAHLAAAVGAPALVLWSEGPFKKWYSRGKRHAFVHATAGEKTIPIERVWQAMQPFLTFKKDDFDQKWAAMLEPPPSFLPPSSGLLS